MSEKNGCDDSEFFGENFHKYKENLKSRIEENPFSIDTVQLFIHAFDKSSSTETEMLNVFCNKLGINENDLGGEYLGSNKDLYLAIVALKEGNLPGYLKFLHENELLKP